MTQKTHTSHYQKPKQDASTKQTRKAFTLMEMMITMVIVGMMFIVIFKTYDTVSNLTWRIEAEKLIQTELLYVTQALQTLADSYTVDYQRYEDEAIDLIETQGMTTSLYLVDDKGERLSIQALPDPDCFTGAIESEEHLSTIRSKPCAMTITNDDAEQSIMTDPALVRVSHMSFKITPYASNQRLLYSGAMTEEE